MITAGEFRKGVTIEWDGGVWNVVDFQHAISKGEKPVTLLNGKVVYP